MAIKRMDVEAAAFWMRTMRSLNVLEDVQSTVEAVVRLAAPTVSGADYAGLTVLSPEGEMVTAAASDDIVHELDQLQRDLDGGPCLAALRADEKLVRVEDMAAETRWPRFAASARERGVRSMLSCHMTTPEGTRAALNFHSAERAAFDDSTAQIAAIYTAHAAIAVGNAELVESMRKSARTRQTIGEATGILMERHKVTSGHGFAMLVAVSQDINVKVRDIAEFVVSTGQDPQHFDTGHFGG